MYTSRSLRLQEVPSGNQSVDSLIGDFSKIKARIRVKLLFDTSCNATPRLCMMTDRINAVVDDRSQCEKNMSSMDNGGPVAALFLASNFFVSKYSPRIMAISNTDNLKAEIQLVDIEGEMWNSYKEFISYLTF